MVEPAVALVAVDAVAPGLVLDDLVDGVFAVAHPVHRQPQQQLPVKDGGVHVDVLLPPGVGGLEGVTEEAVLLDGEDQVLPVVGGHVVPTAEDGDAGAALLVLRQHGVVVDVGHHVAVTEQHVLGLGGGQEGVDVADGVQVAPVHPRTCPGVGGQDGETADLPGQVPLAAGPHVVHQGMVVGLGDHAHVPDTGVDHVGKGEVHQAVPPAVGHRAHGPHHGQVTHPVIVHIGEDDPQNLALTHGSPPPGCRIRSWPWGERRRPCPR